MTIKKLALAAGLAAMVTAPAAYASVIDRPFFKVLGVVIVWGADGTGNNPVVSDFYLMDNASGTAGSDIVGGDVTAVLTGTLDPVDFTGSGDVAEVDPITGEVSGGAFTGNGDGVLNAGDSLGAFEIDDTTDVAGGLLGQHESSFYVASNTAFDVYAQTSNVVATGDWLDPDLTDGVKEGLNDENITFAMAVATSDANYAQMGAAAQDPTGTAGTGYVTTVDSLDDMNAANPVKVFDGGQRTAASTGSIMQQSVRFDMTYGLQDDAGNAGYDLSLGAGTLQADVTYTIYVP